MARSKKTCDVFISHAASDASLATEVANMIRASGLEAITDTELLPGKNPGDALWEALAESRALLTILSPSGPTPSMALEMGAARAWNKPIYGVVTDPSSTRPTVDMSGVRLYTVGRVQDIIKAIESSNQEFSDDDRIYLTKLYRDSGVTVDHLALDLHQLGKLVKKFNESKGTSFSGERILSELFRMRKRGTLVQNRIGSRPKAQKDSA